MDEQKLIPGATTTDSFTLPVEAQLVRTLTIDYRQGGVVLFSKTKEDCVLEGTSGKVELTQEDTLKFKDNSGASVQIVVMTHGGEVIPSYPVSFVTGMRLNRVVLE